jgi:hypothetical protein
MTHDRSGLESGYGKNWLVASKGAVWAEIIALVRN